MKGLSHFSAGLAATICFATSAVAQVDPIVIKVRGFRRLFSIVS